MYGKEFFGLQLEFARKVSILAGLPLERALLSHTNFYIRFALGREFDSRHPGWQRYLAGLRTADDLAEWSYRFYRERSEAPASPPVVATFGCFAYARRSHDRIRLHFRNDEADGRSPLAVDRQEQRRAELAALFAHVKGTSRSPVGVVGASWLYNLEAYRRLFPKAYLATARVIPRCFQHMPLWGQFLHRGGELREWAARQFRERLAGQSGLETLDECFPLQVLRVEASAVEFYDYYRV